MSFRSIAAGLSVSAVLAGCAGAGANLQRPVPAADLGKTHAIGVFSNIGDTVNGRLVGLTAFGNESFTAWTPQWGIDRDAAVEATRLLATTARWRITPLERGAVATAPLQDGGAPSPALWDAAARQGDDTLVVLAPDVYDDYPFFPGGVGLYEHAIPTQRSGCVYAAFSVHVYDVATRRELAWEWGGNAPCGFGQKAELPFRKTLDAYAPPEQALLRKRIAERVGDGLDYALVRLGMVRARPATDFRSPAPAAPDFPHTSPSP